MTAALSLAKSVLISLGKTLATLATDIVIQRKFLDQAQ